MLLEPVRSADPPIIFGTVLLTISKNDSDALRVAMGIAVENCSFLYALKLLSKSGGSSPLIAFSKIGRRRDPLTRSTQAR